MGPCKMTALKVWHFDQPTSSRDVSAWGRPIESMSIAKKEQREEDAAPGALTKEAQFYGAGSLPEQKGATGASVKSGVRLLWPLGRLGTRERASCNGQRAIGFAGGGPGGAITSSGHKGGQERETQRRLLPRAL